MRTLDEMYPSKYLKPVDLQGRKMSVLMQEIGEEEWPQENGTVQYNYIAYLAETPKILKINKTNGLMLGEMYGEPYNWSGKRITIYPTKINVKGKIVDTIMVEYAMPENQTGNPSAFGTMVNNQQQPAPTFGANGFSGTEPTVSGQVQNTMAGQTVRTPDQVRQSFDNDPSGADFVGKASDPNVF